MNSAESLEGVLVLLVESKCCPPARNDAPSIGLESNECVPVHPTPGQYYALTRTPRAEHTGGSAGLVASSTERQTNEGASWPNCWFAASDEGVKGVLARTWEVVLYNCREDEVFVC